MTLIESVIDKKKLMKKMERNLIKVYNHYLDKRRDLIKRAEKGYHEKFGDFLRKNVSAEKISNLDNFFAKWKKIPLLIKDKIFKARGESHKKYERFDPPQSSII